MKRAMFTVLPVSFVLACTGAMGVQGDKGDEGPRGEMGDRGVDGDKGDPGAAGDKGDKGDPGQKGGAGPPGLHCWDLNGNGLCDAAPSVTEGEINEDVDDSGACDAFDCQGAAGQPGARGTDGAKGDMGPQGPPGQHGAKGDRGETGPLGPQGDKGDRGEIGPQGPRGDKGDRGEIGPPGTFTASACQFVTGELVAGTNTHGGRDTSKVTCPVGTFAMGIFPIQQVWNLTSTCQPISFRADSRTIVTDWFSMPKDIGTGCEGNSFATATLCCP